ncbi:MAG: hypothetical protein HY655_06015 [Acidobacteria bacterium]|nr:hypothetical protein [Acidobacteriota bacterium]
MHVLLAAAGVVALSAVVHTQTPTATAIPPAFLGTWVSLGLNPGPPPLGAPPTELPYAEIDKRLGEFLQPWAVAEQQALEWNTDDTGQVCKPTGIFRQGHGTGAGNFRFVEAAPGKLYQIWSSVDQRGVQRIYLNSPRPRNVPLTWNGDSRGRFDGTDTLYVDTFGFNAKSWLNSDRWPHTEELRVIERYRLYGNGAYMQVRVFVDDRRALKAPYTYTRYYRKVAEPTEGGENVCNQNPPEEDLWAMRRRELLAQYEARLAALVARYADERLPDGSGPSNAVTSVSAEVTLPAEYARIRGLAGIYQSVPAGARLARGLAASGAPAEISLLPPAADVAKSRDLTFDPGKHCMVVGPFRMMARDDARFEVVVTANRITLLFENVALGHKREIYLGRSRHPEKLTPSFLGDSIGRWDGDAFVVDTIGFNELTWLNDAGAPHSETLRLVERFRLVEGGQYLEYRVTAEDPKVLTKPYTYTRYFQRSTQDLREDFCDVALSALN